MYVTDLASCTNAWIVHAAQVSFVAHVSCEASAVREKSLFIDKESSFQAQKLAIENGAYCVLSQLPQPKNHDLEVWYLLVRDIRWSSERLFSFFASANIGKEVFYFSPLEEFFVKKIISYRAIKWLYGDIFQDIGTFCAKNKKINIASNNLNYLKKFFNKINRISNQKSIIERYEIKVLSNKRIVKVRDIKEKNNAVRLNISSFYFEVLQNVAIFATSRGYFLELSKLKDIDDEKLKQLFSTKKISFEPTLF